MYDEWWLGINMSLSVLLPVYGEAGFICEAIISTLDDIELEDELIIILDRTSDNTKAIIEDFASKYCLNKSLLLASVIKFAFVLASPKKFAPSPQIFYQNLILILIP